MWYCGDARRCEECGMGIGKLDLDSVPPRILTLPFGSWGSPRPSLFSSRSHSLLVISPCSLAPRSSGRQDGNTRQYEGDLGVTCDFYSRGNASGNRGGNNQFEKKISQQRDFYSFLGRPPPSTRFLLSEFSTNGFLVPELRLHRWPESAESETARMAETERV